MTGYDHIIVGAGSAGCVLAARLSEDPQVRVLLIEAGGRNTSVLVRMPAGVGNLIKAKGPSNWGFHTEPEPNLDGRHLWWPRGRGVATFAPQTTDSRRRPYWRDLHALTGVYVGGVVLFLAVTGMPWSAVWGDKVMGAVKETGLGRPPAPVAGAWQRAQHHDAPVGQVFEIEGVQGLAHLQHHIVGDVDDIVDGALAHRSQAVLQPVG